MGAPALTEPEEAEKEAARRDRKAAQVAPYSSQVPVVTPDMVTVRDGGIEKEQCVSARAIDHGLKGTQEGHDPRGSPHQPL